MILPAIGDRCSCGHVWTAEEVARIWERSPISDHIDTITAVVRDWYYETFVMDFAPGADRKERLAFFAPEDR